MLQLRKVHKQQKGFTILEVLVVLSIMAILFSIIVPVNQHLFQKKTEEEILQMFLYDVLYIQNQSMISDKQYVRMVLNKKSYTIIGLDNEYMVRELPNGWEIDRRTLSNISFNHNGSIRKAGTIQVISPNNKYNVIFPIGKGRGYIENQ